MIRVAPTSIRTLNVLEAAAVKGARGIRAADVKVLDRRDVDGNTAIHISGGMNLNGIESHFEQFNTIHGNALYILTFSFGAGVPPEDRATISQSVLDTWEWTS